jgi:hypothetical protein
MKQKIKREISFTYKTNFVISTSRILLTLLILRNEKITTLTYSVFEDQINQQIQHYGR